ncbi:ABC transporter ATP-binding protein/permease [Flindersiella endophytica]
MGTVDRRLLRHAAASRTFLLLSAVIGLAQVVLVVVQALLLARVIAAVFAGGAGLGEVAGDLTVLAVVFGGRALLVWVSDLVAYRASAAVKSILRLQLMEQVTRLGPRWLAGERNGDLATLVLRGTDALDAYFARYLPQLLLACLVPFTLVAWLLATDWQSALIVLVTLPLIPVFMILVGQATKERIDRQWDTLQSLTHHFLDVLSGLGTLKAFGRSRIQVETIRRLAERQRRAGQATLRLAFLSALVLEVAATLSVALVAVSIGLRVVDGTLGFETALFVLIVAPEAYLPLRQVGLHYHASAEGLGAAERIFAVLDEPGRPARTSGAAVELVPGRTVGLVGPNGAGKTTALRHLLEQVGPERVGWLPQDPCLFAGTVAGNIRLGDPAAGDAAVDRAARIAQIDVPLDRLLGERGNGLSAGQARRVALARALLNDPPVLLLDEPTEGVDTHTERAILEALRDITHDRTVVLATHRPALLELCDHIVHLEQAPPTAVAA